MREGKEGCCYFRNPGLKRTFGLTVSLRPYTYAQSVLTSKGTWPTSLSPESTNKRIVSDDFPEIKVAGWMGLNFVSVRTIKEGSSWMGGWMGRGRGQGGDIGLALL